jgi:hypothetical protein
LGQYMSKKFEVPPLEVPPLLNLYKLDANLGPS